MVAGVFLTTAIISLPVERYKTKTGIQKFNITKITYEKSRKNPSKIENAAIQIDIAEMNRWLVDKQFWNNTIFDLWIPDEIIELKPLE